MIPQVIANGISGSAEKKALPQNQWLGFGVKSGFARQITFDSPDLIGVETRERFQCALNVCR